MTWLKRLLALTAFAVVLYLFWPLLAELKNAAELFREVSWLWLGVAAAVQLLSYLCLAGLNYFLLLPFTNTAPFWRLMAILPAMAFIEVAIPSAGASGLILRARLLRPNGVPPEASTFTLILETAYLTTVLVALSLIGVWHLAHRGEVNLLPWPLLAWLTWIIVGGVLALHYWGKDPQRVRRGLDQLLARWHRLRLRFKRSPVARSKVVARVDAFYDGLAQLERVPRWRFWATSLGRVSLDVATLGACFFAFGYVLSLSTLLTGYGLMLALSALAALPGGLGLADASLVLIFTRLGAPGAVAVAAALAYRLISFWLLRFVGFFTWQFLESRT